MISFYVLLCWGMNSLSSLLRVIKVNENTPNYIKMMTKKKLLWYEYNYLFRVKRCDDVRECSFRIYRYFCYLIQGYHTKQISDTLLFLFKYLLLWIRIELCWFFLSKYLFWYSRKNSKHMFTVNFPSIRTNATSCSVAIISETLNV